MDCQLLNALHPSLPCADIENMDAEQWKFRAAPVPAPAKTPRWLQAKCAGCADRHHKLDNPDRNQFFSFHQFWANFVRFIPFRSRRLLCLTVLAPALSKMSCRLRLCNLFEKPLVQPKEISGSWEAVRGSRRSQESLSRSERCHNNLGRGTGEPSEKMLLWIKRVRNKAGKEKYWNGSGKALVLGSGK